MKVGDYAKTHTGSIVILISRHRSMVAAWNCIIVYSKDLEDIARQRLAIVFEPGLIPVKPIFLEE